MRPDARLLLVEHMMPERLEASERNESLARSDLHMLVALGAQERAPEEFEVLLQAAGLATQRVLPTDGDFQIIEAAPVTRG